MRPPLNNDPRLRISLAGRPSNIGTRFHFTGITSMPR
jgi:shikimate dehydrogenase